MGKEEREGGREREKGERERRRERGGDVDVRKKHQYQLVASHTCPDWGLNPQPKNLSWLGIEQLPFWCTKAMLQSPEPPGHSSVPASFGRNHRPQIVLTYSTCYPQAKTECGSNWKPSWLRQNLRHILTHVLPAQQSPLSRGCWLYPTQVSLKVTNEAKVNAELGECLGPRILSTCLHFINNWGNIWTYPFHRTTEVTVVSVQWVAICFEIAHTRTIQGHRVQEQGAEFMVRCMEDRPQPLGAATLMGPTVKVCQPGWGRRETIHSTRQTHEFGSRWSSKKFSEGQRGTPTTRDARPPSDAHLSPTLVKPRKSLSHVLEKDTGRTNPRVLRLLSKRLYPVITKQVQWRSQTKMWKCVKQVVELYFSLLTSGLGLGGRAG